MPDYQNGKIYCLRSHNSDDVYYGSTTQPLSVRLAGHVCNFKRWDNGTHYYTTSFKIIEQGDYYIELFENYPCENKEELNKREGEIIRENECVNRYIAGRKLKQYYQDNKEQLDEKHKQYSEKNKEQLSEYMKKYYEKNKEQLTEKQKIYLEKNKEQIAEKKRQPFTCECGSIIRISDKAKHLKTAKHQKYLSTTNEQEPKPKPEPSDEINE